MNTGELDLAFRLLSSWASTQPFASFTNRQPTLPADLEAGSFASLFPEIVQLVEVLTDPHLVNYLLSPQWGAVTQTKLLLSSTADIARGEPPSDVIGIARTIILRGRVAVAAAYGMVGTRRTSRAATLDRALIAAARTHRACLLRHLDTRGLPPNAIVPRMPAAPRTRIFAAAEYEADPAG